MQTILVRRLALVALLAGLGACDAASITTSPPAKAPHRAHLDVSYGYAERLADSPEEFDDVWAFPDDGSFSVSGQWECPELIHRGISMSIPLGGGERPHFEFKENITKERDVPPVYNPTAPLMFGLPHAEYRTSHDAISDDARWIAVAPQHITVACRGQYVRAPGFIVWAGKLWGVSADGEIRSGPNYSCASGGGTGSLGDNALGGEYDPTAGDGYDPYSPTGGSGGCTPGGSSPGPAGTQCHQEYAYLDELINGEWVQIWEGWVSVCE